MLKQLLSWLSLLSPKGRCGRLTWWIVTVLLSGLCQIPFIFGILLLLNDSCRLVGILLSLTFGLLSLWLPVMIAARRFRDIGYSPLLTLIYLIPPLDGEALYLSWILIFIICGFFRSKGSRRSKVVTRTVTKESPST